LAVHVLILAASFLIILAGSEMFTNGVEWAGQRLQISEAAVGSLLAAVGTALPETFVPAIALLAGRDDLAAHSAVGLGAIIGAPLMLSTLALAVMGMAGVLYRSRRGRAVLDVRREDVRRDLAFFLPTFFTLVLLGLIHPGPVVRSTMAFVLLAVYCVYGFVMLRLKRADHVELEQGLHFERIFGGQQYAPRFAITLAQIIAGVAAILFGAMEFVDQIILFARHANLNPGVLSLILSPLATELPEKYNSVVWIRQRKDNLALANITGAMVFQSCIPVALGVAFTPWVLTPPELLGGTIGLVSAMLLYLNVRDSRLGTPTLMIGGVGYAGFIVGLGVLGFF